VTIEMRDEAEPVRNSWRDQDGFVGPLRPGTAGRRDPAGDFPTGPAVGERLPEIVAADHRGHLIDVHGDRGGRPAVVVFYRSAVW
jgi:hypothetical protein